MPHLDPEVLRNDPNPGRAFAIQDRALDRTTSGPHWLKDPRIAGIFTDALLYGERVRRAYDLLAWVVMPNHVHVVLQPNKQLPKIVEWLTGSATGNLPLRVDAHSTL
ncbi:MAG TPA: hypothetical protein VLW65_19565 [Bryobacteraceae bacterium]|nr:hypothetical protein [Bryobacteraceae bacterium]